MKGFIAVLTGTAVVASSVLLATARAEETTETKDACLAKDASGEKAGHEKAAGERKRPALTEMTVTGKISKEEKQGKDGKTWTHYILTDAAGNKVMLSDRKHRGKDKGKEGEAPAVNLADYVDKNVTIGGKGFSKERDGKKMTRLVKITKIEVVAATPAAN